MTISIGLRRNRRSSRSMIAHVLIIRSLSFSVLNTAFDVLARSAFYVLGFDVLGVLRATFFVRPFCVLRSTALP
jgi:hypothetical protein